MVFAACLLGACGPTGDSAPAAPSSDCPEPVSGWRDADHDGFGDPNDPLDVCGDLADALADNSDDCDDQNVSAHPDADERCNLFDDDCDGAIDEDAVGAPLWYADVDGDGFGDLDAPLPACTWPDGFVPDATDCDDVAPTTHPGAAEQCDSVDNDCNDVVDDTDQLPVDPYFPDVDDDGYGDPAGLVESCQPVPGHVTNDGDCDDAEGAVNPGALEVCGDGVDSNCDARDCDDWSDDFEAAAIDPLYVNVSASPWRATNTQAHAGAYSGTNGDIGDSGRTALELTLDFADGGDLTFWYKVDSESSYDYLKFYVDGSQKGSWSGSVGWTELTTAVTAGSHTFKWEYSKDGSVSSGADSAWIDDVYATGGSPP
jgi:hypothetical protein